MTNNYDILLLAKFGDEFMFHFLYAAVQSIRLSSIKMSQKLVSRSISEIKSQILKYKNFIL